MQGLPADEQFTSLPPRQRTGTPSHINNYDAFVAFVWNIISKFIDNLINSLY